MFRTGFLWRFLLALILLGLLTAGGMALYRLGFAQGYQTAALAANSAGNPAVTPNLPGLYPYPYFWPAYGFHGFFPFGPLLGIGFFLLVFFLIGGLFRGFAWRHFAGRHYVGHPGYGGWGRGPEGHWEWHTHQKPQAEEGEVVGAAPKEV